MKTVKVTESHELVSTPPCSYASFYRWFCNVIVIVWFDLGISHFKHKIHKYKKHRWHKDLIHNFTLYPRWSKPFRTCKTIQNDLRITIESQLPIHVGMLNSAVFSNSFCFSGCSPVFSMRCSSSAWFTPSTFNHLFKKLSLQKEWISIFYI